MNRKKPNPKNEPDYGKEDESQYDEDSIGAAIDMAFDNVICALNELRNLIKQL